VAFLVLIDLIAWQASVAAKASAWILHLGGVVSDRFLSPVCQISGSTWLYSKEWFFMDFDVILVGF
jgi:hypothetical protein